MSETKRPIPWSDLLAMADPGLSPERRAELTERLAASADDRERLIGLLSLKTGLKKASPSLPVPFEMTDACLPTEEMGDFLGGRMPEIERQTYARHVSDCDVCYERAAYYTASSSAMTSGMMTMEKTPAHFRNAVLPDSRITPDAFTPIAGRKGSSPLARMGRWIASPLPAYAFAAALLVALIAGPRDQGLVEYDSESGFSLYETDPQGGPSFGFSDTGRLVGTTDAGLSAHRDDKGDVILEWAPVEGAGTYAVTVTRLTPKGPRDLVELTATEPTATIPASSLQAGELYRYRVAGTVGERLFVATGQFGLPR